MTYAEIDYAHLCSVCYETKYNVMEACSNCSIKLCLECYFVKCKSCCPICDRSSFNREHLCQICFSLCPFADLHSCTCCNMWVCKMCEAEQFHCCHQKIRTRARQLDAISVFLLFYRYKINNLPFRVLGMFETPVGNLTVVKDLNKDKIESILAIWDVSDAKKWRIFLRVCKKTRMRKYHIGNLMRGVKTYVPSQPYAYDHFVNFLSKMHNTRICTTCEHDMTVHEDIPCLNCQSKRRAWEQWRRWMKEAQNVTKSV